MLRSTSVIPIVMGNAADPVGTGLVASLARPGGNITGLSGLGADLAIKALEILKEAVPNATRYAVFWTPSASVILSARASAAELTTRYFDAPTNS